MTPDRIQAFRQATFLKYLREQLAEAEDSKNLADWRVDVAADLIKAALRMESMRETSFTDRDDIAEIASRMLVLQADMQLSRRGEQAGYYPANLSEHVSMLLRMRARTSLGDLLTTASDDEYDLPPAENETVQLKRLDQFLSDHATWEDTRTAALTECLQYLVFSNDDKWQIQLNEVKELSAAIRVDPSLHITIEKADRYSWVLCGATDLVRYVKIDWMGGLAVTLPPVRANSGARVDLPAIASALSGPGVGGRFDELMRIRDELLNRSQYLTSDGSFRTASWLLAQSSPERAKARDDVWHWGF